MSCEYFKTSLPMGISLPRKTALEAERETPTCTAPYAVRCKCHSVRGDINHVNVTASERRAESCEDRGFKPHPNADQLEHPFSTKIWTLPRAEFHIFD